MSNNAYLRQLYVTEYRVNTRAQTQMSLTRHQQRTSRFHRPYSLQNGQIFVWGKYPCFEKICQHHALWDKGQSWAELTWQGQTCGLQGAALSVCTCSLWTREAPSELVQRLFDVSVVLFFHRNGLLEKDAFKLPRIVAKTPVDKQPWRRRT